LIFGDYMSYVRTKFSSAVMAESVSKGFLASLHAERLLRGKQHAKTAPATGERR
jgi:hypothetical protein